MTVSTLRGLRLAHLLPAALALLLLCPAALSAQAQAPSLADQDAALVAKAQAAEAVHDYQAAVTANEARATLWHGAANSVNEAWAWFTVGGDYQGWAFYAIRAAGRVNVNASDRALVDQAIAAYLRGRGLAQAAGDKALIGNCDWGIQETYHNIVGQNEDSISYGLQAFPLAVEVHDWDLASDTSWHLALCYQSLPQSTRAAQFFRACAFVSLRAPHRAWLRGESRRALMALGFAPGVSLGPAQVTEEVQEVQERRTLEYLDYVGLSGVLQDEDAPAPVPDAPPEPSPEAGESKLFGTVARVSRAARTLVLTVTEVTPPGGTTTALPKPRARTVLLRAGGTVQAGGVPKAFADVAAGAALSVLGHDQGVGRPISARLLLLKTVPAKAGAAALPAQAGVAEAWRARYRRIADRVTALGVEWAALIAKPSPTPAEQSRLASLERDLDAANRASEQFLVDLTRDSAAAGERAHTLADAQGLQVTLHELGHGAVALYTLTTDDTLYVLLVTPDAQKVEQYPISSADLAAKVQDFRRALQDPGTDPRPAGQALYNALFCDGKLEHDLQGAQAKTLMWSLDGSLRYVPVAALYDGHQYLVEKYRNVVFTPVSDDRLKDPVRPHWAAVTLGVTKAHEVIAPSGGPPAVFPSLPGVAAELRAVAAAAPGSASAPGTLALDERFTRATLTASLRRRPPLVHVASHFKFAPGDDTASYLVLGDGSTLSVAQMASMPGGFQGVDLLTLSACDTALGGEGADGREVEGFAALAQLRGAKAVLASLWPVADASTATLMGSFYRARAAGADKAGALERAQLALLRGTGSSAGSGGVGRGSVLGGHGGGGASQPSFTPDPKTPYAHPYYWAPFVLIGNWK